MNNIKQLQQLTMMPHTLPPKCSKYPNTTSKAYSYDRWHRCSILFRQAMLLHETCTILRRQFYMIHAKRFSIACVVIISTSAQPDTSQSQWSKVLNDIVLFIQQYQQQHHIDKTQAWYHWWTIALRSSSTYITSSRAKYVESPQKSCIRPSTKAFNESLVMLESLL